MNARITTRCLGMLARTALMLGLLLYSVTGWAQGAEDFTNLPTTSGTTYQSRSWTGTNSVTWTAEGARTDQTLTGKAICFGTSSSNPRTVTSPSYTGGMGTLSFNYVRGFTGTGARSIEVWVNGTQIGTSITVNATTSTVVNYSNAINVVGTVVLEIRCTGASQVIVDDIAWTAFAPPAPTTTSISPTSATAGTGGFTLTVNGTNFINGVSTVRWDGSNRTTTFVSTTQLTAAILAADVASAGSATVTVLNTGNVTPSNGQTFTINPASGPDCLGVIGGTAQPGTTCNDNNACTINDTWSAACVCSGTFEDTDGDGVCNANDNCPTVAGQIGSTCSDGDACTTGDVLNSSCVCTGTADNTDSDNDGVPNCSDGCPNDPSKITPGLCGCGVVETGNACDDGNACTINDVYVSCGVCAGTSPADIWNFGASLPGTASPTTVNITNVTGGAVSQHNNFGTNALLSTTSASNHAGASGGVNIVATAVTGGLNTATSTYFEVTMTPDAGYSFTLNAISFGMRSTGTGPPNYSIRTSTDSYAADIASGTSNGTWLLKSHTGLTATAGSSPLTIRIYGYNAVGPTAGAGTWRVDDLTINGCTVCLDSDGDGICDSSDPCQATSNVSSSPMFNAASCGANPGAYLTFSTINGLQVATDISTCPAGSSCAGGTAPSVPCPAGRFSDVTGSEFCQQCATGHFSSTIGSTTCQSCAAGSFSDVLGATECQSCAAGSFSSTTGATTCTSCAAGSFSSSTGATECTACEAGKFSSSTGATECLSCGAGTFSSTTGSTECTACGSGTYNPTLGATECLTCNGTTNAPIGATSCTVDDSDGDGIPDATDDCQATSNVSGSPLFNAASCGADPGAYLTFSTINGLQVATDISTCPAGSSCAGGTEPAVLCPAGRFSDVTGAVTCQSCAAGSYSGVAGAVTCTACAAGSFSDFTGATECMACAAGSFSSVTGSTTCTSCAAGSFSSTPGATECTACLAGSYSSGTGATSCTSCEAGRFSSTPGATECTACAAGSFSSTTGSTECTSCGTGTYNPTLGATECLTCSGSTDVPTGGAVCLDYPGSPYCASGTAMPTLSGGSGGTYTCSNGQCSSLVLNPATGEIDLSASAPGIYTVCASGACIDVVITTQPNVAAITGIPPGSSLCIGTPVQLSSATPGGVWSSDDDAIATVSSSGIASGVIAGIVVARYTVTDGACSGEATLSITVDQPPAQPAPITGGSSACSGTQVQLSTTTPDVEWSSTDEQVATVSSTGLVSALSPGTTVFKVKVIVPAGQCTSTRELPFTVDPTVSLDPPVVSLSSGTNPTCGNSAVEFHATGAYSDGGSYDSDVSYAWVTGAGTIPSGAFLSVSAPVSGDVSVSVTSSRACASSIPVVSSNAITLVALPTRGILASSLAIEQTVGTPSTCSGSPLEFHLTGMYDDGSSATNDLSATWTDGVITITGQNFSVSADASSSSVSVTDVTSSGSCVSNSGSVPSPPAFALSVSVTVSLSSVSLEVSSGTNPSCAGTATEFRAFGTFSDGSSLSSRPPAETTYDFYLNDVLVQSSTNPLYTPPSTSGTNPLYVSATSARPCLVLPASVLSPSVSYQVSSTVLYALDSDDDGYYVDGSEVSTCSPPSTLHRPVSTLSGGGDCDDARDDVNPGATEVCDGGDVDEDCDGFVNEGTNVYYIDMDGDLHGNPMVTVSLVCTSPPAGYVSDATDCDDSVSGLFQGSSCDDGSTSTTNDVYDPACVCAGTVACVTNPVVLSITTDAGASQIHWYIMYTGTNTPVCDGNGLASSSTIALNCCLPNGCYDLVVTDDFGDGINPGGYVLRDGTGQRIIDNEGNGATFTTLSLSPLGFCVPLGGDGLQPTSCDAMTATLTTVLQARPNSAVTAEYGVHNANSGYQYWVTNPNGGFSRRLTLTHAAPGTGAPVGTAAAMKATYFSISSMNSSAPLIPQGILLNIRVRSQINGVFGNFGAACRLMIPAPTCATTQLTTSPSPVVSCGATGLTFSSVIWANNVPGATGYQFEFSKPGYTRRILSATRSQALSFITVPLQMNNCYNVRVRISYDNSATYCPFGPTCTITLGTATCSSGMALQDEGDGAEIMRQAELSLWPNPNDGSTVNLTLTGFDATAHTVLLNVTDIYGKLVASRTLPAQDGYLNTAIDFEQDLAPGLYLVHLQAGEQRVTQRLVIQ